LKEELEHAKKRSESLEMQLEEEKKETVKLTDQLKQSPTAYKEADFKRLSKELSDIYEQNQQY